MYPVLVWINIGNVDTKLRDSFKGLVNSLCLDDVFGSSEMANNLVPTC